MRDHQQVPDEDAPRDPDIPRPEDATDDRGTPSWSPQHGARLRQARELAAMTQEQVGQSLGYATRTLTRWENGQCDPGFDKVVSLADLFQVSLDWLAGRTSIQQLLRPGSVLVNDRARQVLESMLAEGKTQDDLPHDLRRNPGINYVFAVPEGTLVMRAEAAAALDERMQQLWKRLGRNRR